jgi:S1-C subfamily serine protease
MEDLGSALYTASPGQLVTVTVARDSKVSNPDVTLAASP